MTLQCALYQQSFSRSSQAFTGSVNDEKSLRIEAKRDAQAKVQAFLDPYLNDSCPNGCDLVNNAQIPRAYIVNRDWSRTLSGQTVTVKVTYDFYVVYICGNN